MDPEAASIRRCEAKLELQRSRARLNEAEEMLRQQRQWEKDKLTFNFDVTLPVTDAVAIAIGKLRELGFKQRVPGFGALLTQLERAIETQMVSYFAEKTTNRSVKPVDPSLTSKLLSQLKESVAEDFMKEQQASAAEPVRLSREEETEKASPPIDHICGSAVSLLLESLCRNTDASCGRIYLCNDDSSKVLQCCATFPPIGRSEVMPKLSRTAINAVFSRGIAVSGHPTEPQDLTSNGYLSEPTIAEEPTGEFPESCLLWPIAGYVKGTFKPLGVIELIDKGKFRKSAESGKTSVVGFSSEDENYTYAIAKTIATMMHFYGVDPFVKYCSSILAEYRIAGAEVAISVPLPSATLVAEGLQKYLRNETFIYRGPMRLLRRAAQNDRKTDHFAPSSSSMDLRSIESALDSLNDMWHASYQENVQMHQQCRRWATQVRDLNLQLNNLKDALETARGIESLEETRNYLRMVSLSFGPDQMRTPHLLGNVPTKDRDLPKSELTNYVEGAKGVRCYTVDAPTKLREQQVIGELLQQFESDEARRAQLASARTPHYQAPLQSRQLRHPTKPPQGVQSAESLFRIRPSEKGRQK